MSLENVSLNAVPHDNPGYAVFYSVTFTPRDSAAVVATAAATAEPDAPAQTAQVTWEVAIVRDAPRTGTVMARLQRGTEGEGRRRAGRLSTACRTGADSRAKGGSTAAPIGK